MLALMVVLALTAASLAEPAASDAASPAPAPASPPTPTAPPAPAASLTPAEGRKLRRSPVVEVFQSCKDAVVNISATQIIKVQSPMGIDSLLEEMFDLPGGGGGSVGRTQEYKATSVGSGFVLHPAGYIVTNAHVVARTAERKAIFPDKREYDAQIVAIDTQRDLAILKIDVDRPLGTLRLGHSADLMIGETAIAIGNPMGYQHTVTAGVVSALDRAIDAGNGVAFKGLIQTDASINPGNSGGPLLNVLGELIGINTAIRGDAQNIGFAIPVDHLRQILPEMLDVERRYRLITGLKLGAEGPAKVEAVEANSPAAKAGLAAGDVLIRLNDQPVENRIDFDINLLGRKAGDTIRLVWTRGGQAFQNVLILVARPKPDGLKLLGQRFGIEVEPVSAKLSKSLGLRGLRGLVVTTVEDGSPADKIGFRRGDIIDQMAGYQPGTIEDAGELLERIQPGQGVPVSVLRLRTGTIYRTRTTITAR
ncbi:MAG: trypsin-like peptidase domain-containing protein [Planctomycetota bacterium]|nr:trypsin-like peptidase domain-containing protein [Planctomycetota bacterium]